MTKVQPKNTTRVYRSPLETLLIDVLILLLERHRGEAYEEWAGSKHQELLRILAALRIERGEP